jgi:hypothetical protein
MRMARINVYVPDRLYQQAKRARLNVSELSQKAIRDELLRRERMKALDELLGDLAMQQGPGTTEEVAAAEAWAAEVIATAERARGRPRPPRTTKARRSA